MTRVARLQSLLMDLECELRSLELWQAETPSAEALASVQPFCIDSLTFEQWLQFIFLPRMTELLANQLPLPAKCQLSPMGEEAFSGRELPTASLLSVLAAIDSQFT